MKKVSIIIRTKNEEKWVSHCLISIFKQEYKSFEVILVDNMSTDSTVKIAERYPIDKVINIENFKPGLAINKGIRASTGEYIVCLSAHCVPKDSNWLQKLVCTLEESDEYAGVYGRQLPLSYTEPVDKRDLLIVFGLDKKIQIKDYFFHNANSIFRRSVWDQYSFDEEVMNIEDRVWGKEVIEAGYKIVYEPDAAVYHYHGLHQGNVPKRVQGVVSVIERVDKSSFGELPESMRPENIKVAAIIPISINIEKNTRNYTLLSKAVELLTSSKLISEIFIVSRVKEVVDELPVYWIDRNEIPFVDTLNLDSLMQECLNIIESRNIFPDSMLYVNHDYLNRPEDLFNELVYDAQYKGFDSIFPGLIDYGTYWISNKQGEFVQTHDSIKTREQQEPQYRAIYGLGCLSSTWLVRRGKMIGGRIGILKLNDSRYVDRLKYLK